MRKSKIDAQIKEIKVFYYASCNTKKDKRFIARLLLAYKQKKNSVFATHLFLIFLLYGNKLFYISKHNTGLTKRIKLLIKEIQGVEMKVKFHQYLSAFKNILQV